MHSLSRQVLRTLHSPRFNFARLSQEQVGFFEACGYLHLEDMLTEEEVQALKMRSHEIILQEDPQAEQTQFISNTSSRDESFINSGDKIKLFMEPNVTDEHGKLKVPLHKAYNKMGHAMHDLDHTFSQVSYQNKFRDVLRSLGYVSPALVQTMYIYKNPRVGTAVLPHTDNTYLMTTPHLSTIAIWLALDDATLDNGCLWGVPGSHLQPTHKFFRVDPDRKGTHFHEEPGQKHMGVESAVPLEVKRGGALVFGGDFVHFSRDNTSPHQRHAYTMHFAELHNNTWSSHNWLQRPNLPFRDYYKE